MAVDWSLDVKKFVPDADGSVIEKIVNYCGIALQSRDGQLVAFKDKKELGLVRENYLKKKLGLSASDAELDEGIASVGQTMKASNFKNRVTVYYLLAQHFGKLDVFGGIAGSNAGGIAAGVAAGVASAVAGGVGAAAGAVSDAAADTGAAAVAGVGAATGAVAGVGAAALAGAGAAVQGLGNLGTASADAITDRIPGGAQDAAYATGSYNNDEGGRGLGWLWWLLGALLLLGLIWWFFLRGGDEPKPAVGTSETVATQPAEAVDSNVATAPAESDDPFKDAVAEGSAAVPVGSGATLELRDGKPVAKVYFDTAKTDVATNFADIAAKFKTYLDKNPGATLGISGFADPRGDAAANAELSKKRAQAVQAQIVSAGVAATSTELVKPEATEQGSGDDAAARRVEVFVKPAA